MISLSGILLLMAAQSAAPDTVAAEPVKVFSGHTAAVYDVALSADGKTLATASFDKTIKLWSVETGSEVVSLTGHTGKILSVAFSGDGRRLLSGGEDKTVKLWDVPSDSAMSFAVHGAAVEALVLSADGKKFATASADKTARIWAGGNRNEEKKFETGAPLRAVAMDPSGTFLAAGGDDKNVYLWRVIPPPPPKPPALSGDPNEVIWIKQGDEWRLLRGKVAAPGDWNKPGFDDSKWQSAPSGFGYSSSASELQTVKTKLDDMKSEKFLSIFLRSDLVVEKPKSIKKLVFKAVFDDGFVVYLNGEEVGRQNIQGTPPAFNAGAASTNDATNVDIDLTPHLGKLKAGKNVLAVQAHNVSTGSSDFVFTPSVHATLVKMQKPEEAKKPKSLDLTLSGSEGTIRAVALSPDGTLVAGAGDDKLIRIWQTTGGKEITKLDQGGVVGALSFTDDNTLVAAGDGASIKVWDIAAAKVTRSLDGHGGKIRAFGWHADKKVLASASDDGTVRLWSVADGKQVREIPGHEGGVLCVSFSGDGTSVVSGGQDKTLRVWNVADGKPLAKFDNGSPVRAVAMQVDGEFYCAAEGNGALDWRVTSKEAVRTFTGHGGYVHSVAFSPDGATVASAGQDKSIRYWNLADGKEIRNVPAHDSTVYCLEYNPDGSLLASGGYDRVVKLWKTADGSEVRKLEGHMEGVFCLLFSRDGSGLFSGSSDRTVRRWDVAEGKELTVFTGHRGWVTGLGLAADDKHLISVGYGGQVLSWDIAEAKPVLERSVGPVVYNLAVSRDGAWLVTANPKNQALLLEN